MYLTYDDLAGRFKVTKRFLRKLVMEDKINSVRIGRCRRFRLVDVESYEEKLSCETTKS